MQHHRVSTGIFLLALGACAAPREPSGSAGAGNGAGGGGEPSGSGAAESMGGVEPSGGGAAESMDGSGADGEMPSPIFVSPPSQVAPLGNDAACAREARDVVVESLALDLLLDSSGSMEELTPGGITKWSAVEQALRRFAADPASARHSLSLQFFPLLKPGSRYTCASHEECGPDGGPCFLSTCLLSDAIDVCIDDADCPGDGNACVAFGLCSNSDPLSPSACVLGLTCPSGLGSCDDFERTCLNATECQAAAYAVPRMPMAPVAEQLGPLDQALSAQVPQGLTPTAPALDGAMTRARQWTGAHPEQPAVVVLATDGLPTVCESDGASANALDDVLAVASAGLAGTPPVRTFVIGVLEAGDGESLANLDAIALAGGTERALLVANADDVSDQFTRALGSVREAGSVCHVDLPQGSGLDFSRMEVSLRAASGAASVKPFASMESGCADASDGWYFEENAGTWRVRLCPALCSGALAAGVGGLSLAVGCLAP